MEIGRHDLSSLMLQPNAKIVILLLLRISAKVKLRLDKFCESIFPRARAESSARNWSFDEY